MTTIFQRNDGRYQAAINFNGKRKHVYGKTQAEVKRKVKELETTISRNGTLPEPGRRTVSDLLTFWLDTASLRPKTLEDYEGYIRRYVTPNIGYIRLAKLEAAHLQQLYAKIPGAQGKKVHNVLHRAFDEAVRLNWMTRNPADRVKAPQYQTKRKELWNEAQLQTFLAGIEGHKYEPLWLLALNSGLRLGELLGLRWGDIDLDAGVLVVRRNLQRVKGQWVVGSPKTQKGERAITLPASVLPVLRKHYKAQTEKRLAAGNWARELWVFASDSGGPMHGGVVDHALGRLCKRLGIPATGHHAMRHLHATLLIAQGLPIPAVSARLGHANPNITMSVYAHAMPAQDAQAAILIEKALAAI